MLALRACCLRLLGITFVGAGVGVGQGVSMGVGVGSVAVGPQGLLGLCEDLLAAVSSPLGPAQ